MDKLLLSTLVITAAVVLTSMPVSSAPMQTSKLISSIDPLQKRYNYVLNDSGDDMIAAATSTVVDGVDDDGEVSAAAEIAPKESLSEANVQQQLKKDDNPTDNSSSEPSASKMTKGTRLRQNKMIGFYPAAPAAVSPYHPFAYYYNQPPPPAVYYPPEFYDDFATFFDNYGGEDDEIMSRTNPGGRRRPIYKNSPIYYIRLPPQPYMFIPGLGYVSQPPTYHPMSLPPPPPPPPQPQPSPFFNLPLDFISNGKPTNIYQWGSPPGISYMPQPQAPAIQPPQNVYSNYPTQQAPQYTQQRPQRPYRPQRPMNPYGYDHQGGDSKITSLKGPQPYIFNGQPTGEIFLLTSPSSYNSYSAYSDPRYSGNSYY